MIIKSPKDINNFKRNVHLTNSARQGWELILNTLDASSKILLPSYIGITEREGSGIYDPVVNTGIKHDFYLLDYDLTINTAEVEKLVKEEEYKLILLVHYFGFKIQNIEEIVKVCKQYNVIVVEDCAHLYNYNLIEYSDVGTFGDFAFYSLHKNFPFIEGGMLVQNNLEIKSTHFTPTKKTHQLATQWIEYDAKAIAEKRIENFKIIQNLINNIAGVKSLKTIKDGDIPHNYPIIIENGLREKLYFWLMDKNVPLIALYYRLVDPLQVEKYISMQIISNNILNLPVHQDITFEDIKYIIELIKRGILELSE